MTTISKKDTYKSIFDIAVPATLESLFLVVISMVDTQMVSGLGTEVASAISLTTQPKLFCFSIFYALAISATILISQAYGRNAKKEANECFATIVRITIVFAIIMSVLTVLLANPIMSICNGQPDTVDMSVTYFRIIMGGMIFQVVLFVLNASLRGLGNSKMTFASNVVSGIVNIIFNYLLIQGHFGFPALGVAGAAIATVIGTAFACAASALYLLKKDSFINISFCIKHRLKASADSLKKIRHNTLTYFSESIFTRVGFLLSSIILAQLGSFDNSVYSVGMLLMNVSFAFADGIQASILTLVGKAQGSGEKKQVPQYVKAGIKIGVIVSIALAILFNSFHYFFRSVLFCVFDQRRLHKRRILRVLFRIGNCSFSNCQSYSHQRDESPWQYENSNVPRCRLHNFFESRCCIPFDRLPAAWTAGNMDGIVYHPIHLVYSWKHRIQTNI